MSMDKNLMKIQKVIMLATIMKFLKNRLKKKFLPILFRIIKNLLNEDNII